MIRITILALAFILESLGSPAAATPAYVSVTTLAGSGASGVRDGNPRQAEFMQPMGIASDRQGNLYVADAAAQRIRRVSSEGSVDTVAGGGSPAYNGMWVEGGYQDGPVLKARFDRPSDVALAPDGVYVADTLNHCIRRIAGGSVTTFAGNPAIPGQQDGPSSSATFMYPRALTFDGKGDLYVADFGVGIREITPQGAVSTVPLPTGFDSFVLGMSFFGPAEKRGMLIYNRSGFVALDSNLKELWRKMLPPLIDGLYDLRGGLIAEAVEQAKDSLGKPFSALGLPDGSVIYTDARTQTIRTLDPIGEAVVVSAVLNAPALPDASDRAGGYRDGILSDAMFDAPMGLAQLPDGSVAVADAGNRRIRRLSTAPATNMAQRKRDDAPDLSPSDTANEGAVFLDQQKIPGISDTYYRIAYIGNSFTYWNTRWTESIPGLIEQQLRSHWKQTELPRKPRLIGIYPLRNVTATREYIRGVLASGVVDAVVLQVNTGLVTLSYPMTADGSFDSYRKTWEAPMRAFMRGAQRDLAAEGIPLVVVINPYPGELTPLEYAVTEEEFAYPDSTFTVYGINGQTAFSGALRKVVARSKVPFIDLFPAFIAAEQSDHRVPLFGTVDVHFSAHGRALAAHIVADSLLKMRPWAKQRPRVSSPR